MIIYYIFGILFTGLAQAITFNNVTSLTGTWCSKSGKVITGPGFYDPVDEYLAEPALPGMSVSFTDDGYFEYALYSIESNPQQIECPSAVLQYLHGQYSIADNGSVLLYPIKVDSRQLLSNPCSKQTSVYTRLDTSVLVFKGFEIVVDNYIGNYMLQLYEWDGSVVNPLYLKYRPALMLPTITLNPTAVSTTASATDSAEDSATPSTQNKFRRGIFERAFPVDPQKYKNIGPKFTIDYDFWWWTSVTLMFCGSVGYFLL